MSLLQCFNLLLGVLCGGSEDQKTQQQSHEFGQRPPQHVQQQQPAAYPAPVAQEPHTGGHGKHHKKQQHKSSHQGPAGPIVSPQPEYGRPDAWQPPQHQSPSHSTSPHPPSHPVSPQPYSHGHPDQNQINQHDGHYMQLRARANTEGDAMARCFSQSQEAYARGDGAQAKELSTQGKEHQRQMNQLNKEASDWIFVGKCILSIIAKLLLTSDADSKPGEIDLHGLFVKEAVEHSDRAIQEAKQRGESSIHLIVGKGLHSPGGVAKIKPAIEELMVKHQLSAELDPHNAGVLIVNMNSTSRGSGAARRNQIVTRCDLSQAITTFLFPAVMFPLSSLVFLSSWALVNAGSANKGDNCSQADNRLQLGTYQFFSDCNSVTYCAANNTCLLKGCRKDQFPFGYVAKADLPPLCATGEFCPDEADACQPVLPVGSACQLNRDDQCEGPPNFKQLRDTTGRGLNVNGSVCLNNVCMWANATSGSSCVVENTAYIAYGATGEFIDIVSRGNCVAGLYCDAGTKQCMAEKSLGASCTADKECSSWNCLASGVCGIDTTLPKHVGIWVYVVVAIGIFVGIFGTLLGLFVLHRRQRDDEREKRMQYWREQNAFHQNLMQMMRTSIPGGPASARSTMYSQDRLTSDDAGIMQHPAPKASGLRNYMRDDDNSDYDDSVMMEHPRREDGRF
ncbi:unnamed protein product [Mycena citricolor]|uniref:Smr domain-containing protein n=1 Tax=Mycena citricolor TaxID=2018698 RepID=A0AAD2HUS8_9AGAR|nr:unnamed protein product [Mycena citricolor]